MHDEVHRAGSPEMPADDPQVHELCTRVRGSPACADARLGLPPLSVLRLCIALYMLMNLIWATAGQWLAR